MNTLKRVLKQVAFATVVMVVGFSGCSDDKSPTAPEAPDEKGKGTIIIDQTPDVLIGSGWSLTGPENRNGSGDTILTDMAVGIYTLTWNAVSGYLTTAGGTKTLAVDGTITFNGEYITDPGGVFVLVPADTFSMGSPTDESSRDSDEIQHTVILTMSIYMFNTEVTNAQYAELAIWAYDNGYCTAIDTSLRDNLDG